VLLTAKDGDTSTPPLRWLRVPLPDPTPDPEENLPNSQQREQFMAVADRELTGHRWHPSVAPDKYDEYNGRRRILFALERDMHAAMLDAWRLPAFPADHPDRLAEVRRVRVPGADTSTQQPPTLISPQGTRAAESRSAVAG
jgi:hypothetical protein